MSELICGFQVVKTESSFISIEPYNKLKNIIDRKYQGISRLNLYDITEDYYGKKLTKEMNEIVKNCMDENNDLSLEIFKNFEDAIKVLEYSNTISRDNEIITLKSEALQSLKGSFIFDKKQIEWLGFDVISYGYGSIILDGIFLKYHYFEEWLPKLNNNGLFDSTENINDFIAYYTACAKKDIVEELPYSRYGYDAIAVGRVNF